MRRTIVSALTALCITVISMPAFATVGVRIQQVVVLSDDESTELVITGFNFDNGRPPRVFLSGIPLDVTSAGANVITATAPANLVPGSYEVVVRTGLAAVRRDRFDGVTIGAVGETGETGPHGPEGPQGPAGADGTPGPAGPQGPKGPKGPAGPPGADGAAGAQGPEGPAGTDGERGPEGARGPTGPEGPRGEPGPVGPQGPIGLTGAQGPAGEQGRQGDTGAQGPAGPPGPQGPAGDCTDCPDVTPPQVLLTAEDNVLSDRTTITVALSDDLELGFYASSVEPVPTYLVSGVSEAEFSVEADLELGANTIFVYAWDTTGNMTKASIDITRITNQPPVIESFTLEQSEPGADIVCNAVATDPDGDRLTIRYRWRVDGSAFTIGRGTLLFGSEVQDGDVVSCEPIASDGIQDSPPVSRKTLTARGVTGAPVITSVVLSGGTFSPAPVFCNAEATDPDGDELSYEFSFDVDGFGDISSIVQTGASAQGTVTTLDIVTVTCNVTVFDAQGNSVSAQSGRLVVANPNPL